MSSRRSCRARTETQLPQATFELIHSRGPLLSEPLPAAAIEWATVLTATVLPEGQPYPPLYEALEGLLDAIEAAPSAVGWGAALVRYELLLLAELGFGLDLDRCAVTGTNDDLVAVSPKSGRAVSAAEAEPYRGKLLTAAALRARGRPRFVERNRQGLDLTGHFLLRDMLTDRSEADRRSAKQARRPVAPRRWSRLGSRVTIDTLAMLFPNVAVTRGIAVRVAVSFLAEQSDPSSERWFWSYHVRIENGAEVAVQLLSRSWTIVDGRGTVHEVVGEGVVGEMPLIAPGASFDYVSGCPLDTPTGVDERKLSHGRRRRHRVRRRDSAVRAHQCLRRMARPPLGLRGWWYILLIHRAGLLRALQEEGFVVVAAAPEGKGAEELRQMGVQHRAFCRSSRQACPHCRSRSCCSVFGALMKRIKPVAFIGFHGQAEHLWIGRGAMRAAFRR